MTIGDALPLVAIVFSIATVIIAYFHYYTKEEMDKHRIRADLLKAGIDPNRLDKEGEEE